MKEIIIEKQSDKTTLNIVGDFHAFKKYFFNIHDDVEVFVPDHKIDEEFIKNNFIIRNEGENKIIAINKKKKIVTFLQCFSLPKHIKRPSYSKLLGYGTLETNESLKKLTSNICGDVGEEELILYTSFIYKDINLDNITKEIVFDFFHNKVNFYIENCFYFFKYSSKYKINKKYELTLSYLRWQNEFSKILKNELNKKLEIKTI